MLVICFAGTTTVTGAISRSASWSAVFVSLPDVPPKGRAVESPPEPVSEMPVLGVADARLLGCAAFAERAGERACGSRTGGDEARAGRAVARFEDDQELSKSPSRVVEGLHL